MSRAAADLIDAEFKTEEEIRRQVEEGVEQRLREQEKPLSRRADRSVIRQLKLETQVEELRAKVGAYAKAVKYGEKLAESLLFRLASITPAMKKEGVSLEPLSAEDSLKASEVAARQFRLYRRS